MNKRPTLLYFFLLFALTSFAQSPKDSLLFDAFKHEIALDFQNPIRNRLNGATNIASPLATSLMYRRAISSKNGKSRALRFQIGGYLNLPLGTQEIYSNGNTGNSNILVLRNQTVNVFVNFGMEWRRQINRLQFYTGMDTGVGYYRNLGVLDYSRTNSGIIINYNEGRIVNTTIPFIGFFGVKYFIHPRLSLSYEAGMNTSLRFRREEVNRYVPTDPEPIAKEFDYKRTELGLSFDYLRYLNLSYYF